MSTPRAKQLNIPSVHLTENYLDIVPAVDYTHSQPINTFLGRTTSGQSSGVSEDCPAVLLSRFKTWTNLTSASSLQIRWTGPSNGSKINNGQYVTVSLGTNVDNVDGTNTVLSSYIAKAINLAVGSFTTVSPADVTEDGYLRIKSASTGSIQVGPEWGVEVLSDNTSQLIFSTLSAYGQKANLGLVTNSYDGLGGYLYPYFKDGSKVLARTGNLYRIAPIYSYPVYTTDTVPDTPIYGRFLPSSNASNMVISWHGKIKTQTFKTNGIKFAGVNGLFSLTISFTELLSGVSNSITVSLGPNTNNIDDLVTVINEAYNSKFGIAASVGLKLNAPFYPDGTLTFSANGLNDVTVTFDQPSYTNEELVETINGAMGAGTNSAHGYIADFNNNWVNISADTSASNSSIRIIGATGNVLDALGLDVGTYKKWTFASNVGGELSLSLPSGSQSITLSGDLVTKLDLTGQASGPIVSTVRPMKFPECGKNGVAESLVRVLTAEYLDVGDVPENAEFRSSDNLFTTPTDIKTSQDRGSANAFSFAKLDATGKLPLSVLPNLAINANSIITSNVVAKDTSIPLSIGSNAIAVAIGNTTDSITTVNKLRVLKDLFIYNGNGIWPSFKVSHVENSVELNDIQVSTSGILVAHNNILIKSRSNATNLRFLYPTTQTNDIVSAASVTDPENPGNNPNITFRVDKSGFVYTKSILNTTGLSIQTSGDSNLSVATSRKLSINEIDDSVTVIGKRSIVGRLSVNYNLITLGDLVARDTSILAYGNVRVSGGTITPLIIERSSSNLGLITEWRAEGYVPSLAFIDAYGNATFRDISVRSVIRSLAVVRETIVTCNSVYATGSATKYTANKRGSYLQQFSRKWKARFDDGQDVFFNAYLHCPRGLRISGVTAYYRLDIKPTSTQVTPIKADLVFRSKPFNGPEANTSIPSFGSVERIFPAWAQGDFLMTVNTDSSYNTTYDEQIVFLCFHVYGGSDVDSDDNDTAWFGGFRVQYEMLDPGATIICLNDKDYDDSAGEV